MIHMQGKLKEKRLHQLAAALVEEAQAAARKAEKEAKERARSSKKGGKKGEAEAEAEGEKESKPNVMRVTVGELRCVWMGSFVAMSCSCIETDHP